LTAAADASRASLPYLEFYRGRRVMITGGVGFIGSNLARHLVSLGAQVLLIDSLIPDYGGNLFNIHDITDVVRLNIADVRMQTTMETLVRGQDVIFNLAGQVSHTDSMRDPYTDLEINCRAQLSILEACRKNNRDVRVVFAGTRQVYGRPDYLPVDEKHLVRPADINGVNKAAGEYYHLLYNNVFDVRACSLRLTNVYGPRQLIKHKRQGELTQLLVGLAGSGSVRFVEWPPEKKRIDIGSFYSDSSKFRATTGWKPQVTLEDGLRRTLAFYRDHLREYVPDAAAHEVRP
jgi:nucleoside-diphosphate-sugar epimerase